MKFGIRIPSLKRRIAARTSLKRIVRHSMGLKMPRGTGFLTNPKKALYNRIYNKTTLGIDDIGRTTKTASNTYTKSINNAQIPNNNPFTITPSLFLHLINEPDNFGKDGWFLVMLIGIFAPPFGWIIAALGGYWLYKMRTEPWYRIKQNMKNAKKLLKSNNFSEAIPLLQEAYGLDNSNSNTLYLLGIAFHAAGRYEESLGPLKKYLESNPNEEDGKLILAYSQYKLGRYKDVIPLIQQFPQDHQNYLLVILLLGDSFRGMKEYDMAIEVFKRGPLRKTNLDSYLLQLHYLLALTYKEKGSKADAIREFNRIYSYDMNYREVAKELENLKK
jgi:hypothetical protein